MAEQNGEYERLNTDDHNAPPTSIFPGEPSNQHNGSSNIEATVKNGDDDHSRGAKRPYGKRDRLQKKSALDKVEESDQETEPPPRKYSCPMDYWGVRSYLHNFYEAHFYKDPDVYEEEDDYGYLLNNPNRKRCKAIWWKIFVWIGANFLIFGIIGVLIGYLVPTHRQIISVGDNNRAIIDNSAVQFNFNLDLFKLIGLILFCTGGIILTISLLFPSFLANVCEEDRRLDGAIKVSLLSEKKPMKHPSEISIPVTSKVSNVQPLRRGDEALVTQEGMLTYKD